MLKWPLKQQYNRSYEEEPVCQGMCVQPKFQEIIFLICSHSVHVNLTLNSSLA